MALNKYKCFPDKYFYRPMQIEFNKDSILLL